MLKIPVKFVHTLMIMEILVLLCALCVGFVLFYSFLKPCSVHRILRNFEKPTVAWKVATDGYFKVHSYLSLVSDFQLNSNFLMAVTTTLKY